MSFPSAHPAAIPYDRSRAGRTLEALAERGFAVTAEQLPLLTAAFANSPFLGRLAIRDPQFLGALLRHGPQAMLSAAAGLANVQDAPDVPAAMAALRRAKRQAALTVALADIARLWDVDDVTGALTRFADAAVHGALRFLLREAATFYGYPERDPECLEDSTGLVVLAMGKYGAFELNYSSDIDLVIFYDAARFPFAKKGDSRGAAVDIVKGLVKLLSETTADGYVFRTDLRLRPDAGATQVAISTEAAEHYYEAMGQNWERAAYIKARACAGDPVSGAQFLRAMEPFIWRRSLDYAAIEDIHSIKRQIHAHGGHGQIALAGHNIKLGRGGIREIEFFAQTQQLILGGRNPALRSPRTLDAIEALRTAGLVTHETTADLTDAYRYLRAVEHRLQMIEDEQTHTLPKSDEGLTHIANFCGYETTSDFGAVLLEQLETVQGHYVRLFERGAPLASSRGSLVFTGVDDDPETLETLKGLGFRDAKHIAGAIRGWHHGRIRATRSARAREMLTRLMPILLEALSKTADTDAAFAQFDRFVSGVPTGVQLFSMFLNNPGLLHTVAEIAGSAPRLATHLARSPATLDALIDQKFLHELPARVQLDKIFQGQLTAARNYEDCLNIARRFAKEQIFRVGVQIIEGLAKAEEAGPALANVAEAVIAGLLPAVEGELARAGSGRVPGGVFSVIAMGKLGGREMTAASDLDLIFVYDAPADADQTDGPRAISSVLYYARLAQRLISALTTATSEGGLYDVDMRLRPTGNKGPVAVSLESFRRYHQSEAWTWERLALTRARVVAGSQALGANVEAAIRSALTAPADRAKLFADAREMREKLAAQFSGTNRWDLKFAPGGLVDIEFIAQTLQLAAADPNVLRTNTMEAIRALAERGLLSSADSVALLDAAALQHALTHVLRIALDGTLDPAAATPGLKFLLVRAAGVRDFEELEARLASAQRAVRDVFTRAMAG